MIEQDALVDTCIQRSSVATNLADAPNQEDLPSDSLT